MLDPKLSRQRHGRLLETMQAAGLDAAVIGYAPHVYYFTAFLQQWRHEAGFVLFADGKSIAVTANTPSHTVAADDVMPFDASWMGTVRQEQSAIVAEKIVDALRARKAHRVGFDASVVSSQVILQFDAKFEAIDPILWQMRRRKDSDELILMRKAIDCTIAMYQRARQIIEPGIPEQQVYCDLHTAAVDIAGEPLSAHLGNDFACGVGGGPARQNHVAQAGQIYLLDLGPAYRGYFADNCRAFAVDRKPTEAQSKAHGAIVQALQIFERTARPGVRGRDLFAGIDDHLKSTLGGGLPHHLGHGVGLQPHEYPHLNPKWDDTLIEGEIVAVEPGTYGPHLAGGIRLENQYLVTAQGVQNLVDFPLDLG